MTSDRESATDYAKIQRRSFGELIEQGTYSPAFDHAQHAKRFVESCVVEAVESLSEAKSLSILDCGCGTGIWLDALRRIPILASRADDQYYGFDLTPEMIELAREKLSEQVPADHLHAGDILLETSYQFDRPDQQFDLIYAYDVIQQLPPRLQFAACRLMLTRLAPQGVMILFDHDRYSLYGLRMGAKKWVTRRLRIPLVPDFYCNAKYPPLASFRRQLGSLGAFSTAIRIAPEGSKRALVVRRGR